jgi:hypothetical protein
VSIALLFWKRKVSAMFASTVRGSLPDTGVGVHQTDVSFALADWQDLTNPLHSDDFVA